MSIETWPKQIYLQVDEDEVHPFDECNLGEVTWCQDSVMGGEVKYIRADVVEEQLRAEWAKVFLDEIDAAKAGGEFLGRESENVEGRVIVYPDSDANGKQPRVKTVCLFDRNDVLRAAYMLTRDIFNRTQLTTVSVLGNAEPQKESEDIRTALEELDDDDFNDWMERGRD